jgi:hypothetical protein
MICKKRKKQPTGIVDIRIPFGIGSPATVITPREKDAYAQCPAYQPNNTGKIRDTR